MGAQTLGRGLGQLAEESGLSLEEARTGPHSLLSRLSAPRVPWQLGSEGAVA